jgi:prolipoprotein diacylglyceryltransferase/protein-S-isoprenylcysteine O-methyltransferase Ste14
VIGRIAYGFLFCVALPTLLALWAARLDAILHLPSLSPEPAGWLIVAAAVAIILWSMLELWRRGRGLPMNAFPTSEPVRSGPYALFAHPIYIAAVLASAGVSIASGSFAGLVLVTPTLAAGAAALVLGFERHALIRRFGAVPGGDLLRLPAAEDTAPSMRDILAVWARVFIPFIVLYEAIGHLPVPDPIPAHIGGENAWPVLTWTTPIYSAAYPFVILATLLAPTRRALRRWSIDAWCAMAIGFLCYLILPIVAPPRPFDPDGAFAGLLALERADGLDGRAACPSFHVFWAIHAATLIALRGTRAAIPAVLLAFAIVITCVTTGMHALVDLFAGAVLALVAWRREAIWSSLLACAERIANSWREWRVGPARIIVHGLYAGLAAAVGATVITAALGSDRAWQMAIVAGASLLGAGLWGQYWVGSKKLLRPFGYFGSVLGVAVASAALMPLGLDGWLLAASVALAAPWVQSIGRLRCLVQGCCHGAPCGDGPDDDPDGDPNSGIRYRHPRSRVVAIARLSGIRVHATPLYSILANLVIGCVLLRAWALDAPLGTVIGLYLILAGLSRFVEEAYRGEPQTRVIRGLRFYQWCALAMILVGAALSCVATESAPPLTAPTGIAFLWAALIGFVHAIAMGVDFPTSNRRFARLAD